MTNGKVFIGVFGLISIGKRMARIIEYCFVFFIGFLSCMLVAASLDYFEVETPANFFGFNYSNGEAPGDWVSQRQIKVYDDRIVIDLGGASLSSYAATGSMKPVLDVGSNGIRIEPQSDEEINVGDIISFKQSGDLIVHRVIEKGTDREGVYFITKGDNNSVDDGKVRFSQIKYITVGVIW